MNLNILKGILVLLVVVDHNDFSRSLFPRFLDGFSFHVVGFLMIPFLKPAAPWSKDFPAYLFRLYYPFMLIVTLMAVVVAWLGPVTAIEQTGRWLLALYSANSGILKEVTHMALLWYLPSFISLVSLRMAIENSSAATKACAIGLLCIAHVFVGTYAASIRDYVPLGLLPALYVLPLAYLGVFVHRKVYARFPAFASFLAALAIFCLVKYLQMRAGLRTEVGFAEVADYRRPAALLLNDLEAVCGVLMLFQLARLPLGRLLELCGRYSLQIYLFHAFIALAIYTMLVRYAGHWTPASLFALSLLATVVLTVLLAHVLSRMPLAMRFLFPRSPAELLGRSTSRAPGRTAVSSSSAIHSDVRQ
ncbi:acyltransferase [Massilia sp. MS-15]|uniref:acyltransferase family protein n=1 Tax=Massilia sp. MS-15 TaxID=2878200 RepID=UPI001CD23C42|nr:acyltransferase [Massilia sp. MS-15]MCA1245491.1 acyltransferase [Massilia sp. MS-15]